MDGKVKWIFLGVAIFLLTGGVIFILKKKEKKTVLIVPEISLQTANEEKHLSEKLLKYEDEAGFSFEYPEDLEIKDISSENDYSVLEISSPELAGKSIIRVVDSKYQSVEDWLKKAPEANEVGASREITLGGMPGRQIQLENPRRLVTVAVDQGVLFYLESPLEPENEGRPWNKIHNTLVFSFSLKEKLTPVNNEEGAIYKEEEIVE